LASAGLNQVGRRLSSSGGASDAFHQEGFDYKFLHAAGLPEDALRMNVEMKVARLNRAQRPGFFGRFAFGGLAVREPGVGRSLWESPLVAAVGINQKELNGRPRRDNRSQPLAAVKTSRRGLTPIGAS
jgi:hypothetical protein